GLKGVGLSPLFHQLDITDPASVRTARDFFKAQYGGVDVLINYSSVQFMADTTPVQSSNLPIIKPGGNGEHFQHDGFHLGCCSPDLQARLCSDNKTEEGLVRLMERFVKDAEDKIGLISLTRIQARRLMAERPGDAILCNAACPGWVRTGPKAPKSPDESAVTPVYLALLTPGAGASRAVGVREKGPALVKDWVCNRIPNGSVLYM
uniref:Carbonyl reductase 1 n=1 Tax=Pygocentrus nattereri TaxID=42514 RepID=A0A3B4EM24_PYGNA